MDVKCDAFYLLQFRCYKMYTLGHPANSKIMYLFNICPVTSYYYRHNTEALSTYFCTFFFKLYTLLLNIQQPKNVSDDSLERSKLNIYVQLSLFFEIMAVSATW